MRHALVLLCCLIALGFAAVAWRTAEALPKQPKSFRDFPITGDGQTDDTAALQQAIDTLQSIHLPRGVYRLTRPLTFTLKNAAAISADGDATLRMDGPGPALRFVGTHGGTAQPSSVKPETWDQFSPRVRGLDILGNHAEADAVEAEGTMQLTIEGVTIRKCRHGVHLVKRNRNLLVSACHIYACSGIGVFLDDVNLHQTNIVGCHISYCDQGGVVVKAGEVRNIHVAGCDIEACMSKTGPPSANILIDNTGGSTAEVAITGSTLQHSNVPDSANIRILGAGHGFKKGQAARWGHVTIGNNVFSDVAVNVDLKDCRGVTLVGNTFWMGYEYNLRAENCDQLAIGSNLFERNPGYDYGTAATTKNAILFKNCRDTTLTGNHAEGIRAEPAAMALDGCARFHLSGNTILDSDGVGLLMTNCKTCRVSSTFIRHDAAKAAEAWSLKVAGGSENVFSENTLGDKSDVPAK